MSTPGRGAVSSAERTLIPETTRTRPRSSKRLERRATCFAGTLSRRASADRTSYNRSRWRALIGRQLLRDDSKRLDTRLRPPAHALRRARLVRDLVRERPGALANQCDRHRVGAHAVARDAAGGVGGAESRGHLSKEGL